MRVGVFGGSGYTGLELVRLLLEHPNFEIVAVTSEQRAGQAVGDAFPALRGRLDLAFESAQPERIVDRVDFAFTALPHAASSPTVAALRQAGVRVADLSADFRLRDLPLYEKWYGAHSAPEWLGEAVYGLPELYRADLPAADLAAVPGCYPTSVLLPLVPFLRAGLVETTGIVVDAKSGVSGAGRSLDAGYLFAELDANAHAYKVGAHRHGPEMEQEASVAAGEEVRLTFVPQLIPTTRGILTSVYCRPNAAISADDAQAVLESAWGEERFVRVLPQGETPSLQSVRGSNYCDVSVVVDERNGTLVLLAAMDNLVKGASGQALQCANLMLGFPEEMGLLGGAQLP